VTACWRCLRPDTERREVLVQTKDMAEEQLLEECVARLDCVRTRYERIESQRTECGSGR
jgi:hypothetical protein